MNSSQNRSKIAPKNEKLLKFARSYRLRRRNTGSTFNMCNICRDLKRSTCQYIVNICNGRPSIFNINSCSEIVNIFRVGYRLGESKVTPPARTDTLTPPTRTQQEQAHTPKIPYNTVQHYNNVQWSAYPSAGGREGREKRRSRCPRWSALELSGALFALRVYRRKVGRFPPTFRPSCRCSCYGRPQYTRLPCRHTQEHNCEEFRFKFLRI